MSSNPSISSQPSPLTQTSTMSAAGASMHAPRVKLSFADGFVGSVSNKLMVLTSWPVDDTGAGRLIQLYGDPRTMASYADGQPRSQTQALNRSKTFADRARDGNPLTGFLAHASGSYLGFANLGYPAAAQPGYAELAILLAADHQTEENYRNIVSLMVQGLVHALFVGAKDGTFDAKRCDIAGQPLSHVVTSTNSTNASLLSALYGVGFAEVRTVQPWMGQPSAHKTYLILSLEKESGENKESPDAAFVAGKMAGGLT